MVTKRIEIYRGSTAPPKKQRGATLVEILIAVLILGLGLLGMAALQTRALQGGQSATQRSQAIIAIQQMMDSLRVDRVTASAGVYNTLSPDGFVCGATSYLGTTLPDTARRNWLTSMQSMMTNVEDTELCGSIVCDASFSCTVRVRWNDSKAGGIGLQVIGMTSRI
jgi:type IV pilus assembly protein PilV